jgi:hypothetical protein
MPHCPSCNSPKVQKRGSETSKFGETRIRYRCMNCSKWFNRKENKSKFEPAATTEFDGYKKFVITAVQNNCSVNWDFYNALKKYCEINHAKLLLVPFKYRLPGDALETSDRYEVPEEELFRKTARLHPKLRLLADININPTIENPLGGLEALSKGDSLIIAHTQLQMKTLPVNDMSSPIVLTTTGVVTDSRYSQTKTGYRGAFNHSFSAVVIELDDDIFHYRVLNGDDENGFYDWNGYYSKDSYDPEVKVEALIIGDEHVIFQDEQVKAATYTNEDSMVNVLKPKKLVRHDILDFASGSHHHQKSYLTKFAKHVMGTDDIEEELRITLKHIADTTPSWAESVIVDSNHNSHLDQWIDSVEPKQDFRNAKLYHRLMYLMLDNLKPAGKAFQYPSAFKLWAQNTKHEFSLPKIKWLDKNESYKICGIELAIHGHAGANGSRGGAKQFSKFSDKLICGHAHSPSIQCGAYVVGTSTGRLSYANGFSSWANAHCAILSNGKRMMLFIINGRWRA